MRLILGILILLHGIAKLTNGIEPIEGMVTGMGMPAFFAYGVYAGEVVGPLLLIVGFYARIGAALIAINMLFAIGWPTRVDSPAWAKRAAGCWNCRACSCLPPSR